MTTIERKEYIKKWKQNNKEKTKQHSRNWHKKHDAKRKLEDPLYFVKKIYNERKRVCKKMEIPFLISLEDIKNVPKICPVLQIPLISGKGLNNPNAASLDRIIPKLGYIPGNVQWISWRANRIKTDASVEELEKILGWLKNVQSSHKLPELQGDGEGQEREQSW